MSDDKKIVMFDSDEAASFVSGISGWVSAKGFFFGNKEDAERLARFDGCTHRPCDQCGEPASKHYFYCKKCQEALDIERYRARPTKEWDGETMLYSDAYDEYFADLDDIRDFLDPPFKDESDLEPMKIDDLRLVICEPIYVRPLEPDHWICDLPEDGELPAEVKDAIDAFNQAVNGIVISWQPGKYAAVIANE